MSLVQVLSPFSSQVLAQVMVRVLEQQVSVTALQLQLVSGLSLQLQLSPSNSRALVATASSQELISSLGQVRGGGEKVTFLCSFFLFSLYYLLSLFFISTNVSLKNVNYFRFVFANKFLVTAWL